MSDVMYVKYERAFYWQIRGSDAWNPFPVSLNTTTQFYKSNLTTTAIYYTLGTEHGELHTDSGPLVSKDQEVYFSLSNTSTSASEPDPDLDEEVILGIITTNPHGRDFFLIDIPPQERGRGWGKDGKAVHMKDLHPLTLKRLEAYQKKVSSKEMLTKDALQAEGKGKGKGK